MKSSNNLMTRPQELTLVLEHKLKNLWAQYTACLESCGDADMANELRRQYFDLYQEYKSKRSWLNAMENN